METTLSRSSASGFSSSLGGPTWNSRSPRLTAWPSLTRIAASSPLDRGADMDVALRLDPARIGLLEGCGLRLDDGDRDHPGVALGLPLTRIARGQDEGDQQQDQRVDP